MSKVTKAQAEKVLTAVAAWMGEKGYGGPNGEPAPTGRDAAYQGEGPMLDMAWEPMHGDARPTVLLEGGPYDWPIECCYSVQQAMNAAGVPVFVEPINGYALGIYKA